MERVELNLYVRGEPLPQPRPRGRLMMMNGKQQVHIYDQLRAYEPNVTPRKRKAWDAEYWRDRIKERVKAEAMAVGLKPIAGPIRLDLDFYFTRTGEMLHKKWPNGPILYTRERCDRDNLDKLVMDAITQCGWTVMAGEDVKTPLVWFGDGQVCRGEITRWWCGRGDAPGVRIVITRLAEVEATLIPDEPKVLVHPASLLETCPRCGSAGGKVCECF